MELGITYRKTTIFGNNKVVRWVNLVQSTPSTYALKSVAGKDILLNDLQ
jgi:hypothetical protein